MTRQLLNFLLILLCGCAAHAALPVLTVNAPAGVMIQDSTNLVDWQDAAVTTQLTVLATSPFQYFRGRVVPTLFLAWDPSPGATGYKVYYGTKTHNYLHVVSVGPDTYVALTVDEPTARYYLAVTGYDADSETDFSNELVYDVPATRPDLTILKN